MSGRDIYRGPAPKDERLFAPAAWPALRAAVGDLCWLLNRGYATPSALQLVGNRYSLTSRQRMAIARCACTTEAAERRRLRQVDPGSVRGRDLWLDGYNVLTGVEAALAGGVMLLGRDGCLRDVYGIRRRYSKVDETIPALQLLGETTAEWGVARCQWWLDKPVSNSGRLKAVILEVAANRGWNWQVDLAPSADRVLAHTSEIVATSDSGILDRCQHWINLARLVVLGRVPTARLVDLSVDA